MKTNPYIAYGGFEWDAKKALRNLKEHDVSFEMATTVFADPLFIVFKDPDHSIGEQRYIIIGESDSGRHLFVAFTERGPRTRIISARELDPQERRAYEERKDQR